MVLTRTQARSLVEDDAELHEHTIPPVSYEIASYGADFDVEGLIRRLRDGDVVVPAFQRNYVWKLPQASRFIESLLLGLPVPGIFLAREETTNRFLVIDGQQRLKTLQFFYDGIFDPKPDKKKQDFALKGVQSSFEGKTYETLDLKDKRRLDNSIIHATIIKQESPPGDDTSVFHIFERLNSTGRILNAQEIRRSVYQGPFMEEVKYLNDFEPWRRIFGKKSERLKDEELILRFLALYENSSSYRRPMAEFLNTFAAKHQFANSEFRQHCRAVFESTIQLVSDGLKTTAFRIQRALNAAVFDAVMVGIASRLQNSRKVSPLKFAQSYRRLLKDKRFIEAITRSTADEKLVAQRLAVAKQFFADI